MNLTPRNTMLLLFLRGAKEQELDPVRIMKGMFLFAMRAPVDQVPAEARYEFVPYNYGPCAFEIYTDLDNLARDGLLSANRIPGQSWKHYILTNKGSELAEHVSSQTDPRIPNYLNKVRDYVTKQPFSDLLKAVYRLYPDYAKNSVFKS